MSMHSYGLAVDMSDIGRPGSSETQKFRKIAAENGVYFPYSYASHAEWNHCQPTHVKVATAALRPTITADGPKILTVMWRMASALLDPPGEDALPKREVKRDSEIDRHHARHKIAHRYAYRRYAHKARNYI
ncbi:MAG: hypothetical protein WCD69_27935 [Xanthobacteraceae bacterium]